MEFTKTVTMLGSLPPIRGISSYCLELSLAVSKRCRVHFITFKEDGIYPAFLYPGGDTTDSTFPDITCPALTVHPALVWYNPLTWLKEALLNRGDMLHAQWWSLPLFPIYYTICLGFKLRKKPVIMTVHNVMAHEQSKLFYLASKQLFRLCDRMIVHTRINKDQLIRHYCIPERDISVVPHGPLGFFHPHPANPSDDTGAAIQCMKEELHLPPDQKILLVFGAIRAYKGVDTALKAFAQLRNNVPDSNCHLIIAGKLWVDWAPYAKLIHDYKLEQNVTVFHDYIPADQVHRFFEIADLVLLPYRHFDSQTGVGTLATAFRKPMIVTNTGGLPELVRNREMIVQPGDYRGLARSIALAVMDSKVLAEMATDAESVAREISWEGICRVTMELYWKVMEKALQESHKTKHHRRSKRTL